MRNSCKSATATSQMNCVERQRAIGPPRREPAQVPGGESHNYGLGSRWSIDRVTAAQVTSRQLRTRSGPTHDTNRHSGGGAVGLTQAAPWAGRLAENGQGMFFSSTDLSFPPSAVQLLGLLKSDGQDAVPRHLQPERRRLADPPRAGLQASTRRARPLHRTACHRHLFDLPGL